jgi:hypothetical protein
MDSYPTITLWQPCLAASWISYPTDAEPGRGNPTLAADQAHYDLTRPAASCAAPGNASRVQPEPLNPASAHHDAGVFRGVA